MLVDSSRLHVQRAPWPAAGRPLLHMHDRRVEHAN